MPSTLHIVYQNVNHSPQHTHMLLERCAAQNVDVVCIQEPWYGPIRPIPSASPAGPAERTDNNMLYGTQLHPAWQLIEARKDARVACHVNRRLVNAVVSLDSTVCHRDCMLLLIRLDPQQDPTAILNIYNDSNNSAVEYLADIAPRLPAIDVAGGDYNTHAATWDPEYPPDSSARVGEVLDLHARLGLRLLSPPGSKTHFPHNHHLRSTVIDLIWVPDDRSPDLYHIRVAPYERGLSDHAVIHVHAPTGEWSYHGAPTITAKSEEEKEFLADIRASVQHRLPIDTPLQSTDDLQAAVDALFECILHAWQAHAKPLVICSKSVQWWDPSCSEAKQALITAQKRLELTKAYRRLKSALRARRTKHLNERIQFVAEQQRRVWDLMKWVGPR
ncbi:Endonuclease/exonuclease/phosphatase, partial [Trametes meyenii]